MILVVIAVTLAVAAAAAEIHLRSRYCRHCDIWYSTRAGMRRHRRLSHHD